MQGTLPSAPYFVFVCRVELRLFDRDLAHTLDQPLPEVLVPLLPGDADATMDLQHALTNVYDDNRLQLHDRLLQISRRATLSRTSCVGE